MVGVTVDPRRRSDDGTSLGAANLGCGLRVRSMVRVRDAVGSGVGLKVGTEFML